MLEKKTIWCFVDNQGLLAGNVVHFGLHKGFVQYSESSIKSELTRSTKSICHGNHRCIWESECQGPDYQISQHQKIGLRNTDWSSILKSKSPWIKYDLQGVVCGALIDSGAKVNVVDKKFTLKTGIRFVQTQERAEAANRLPLDIVGQSELLVSLGVQVKDGKVFT